MIINKKELLSTLTKITQKSIIFRTQILMT